MIPLGSIIVPARSLRAGNFGYPILSMTMHNGLVDQADKFKKRVASEDTSTYKIVSRGQLVVGFPIDEGVLSFQKIYDKAIVSPAYAIWDVSSSNVDHNYLEKFLRSPRALAFYSSKLRSTTARRRSIPQDTFLELPVPLPPLDEQKRLAAILDKADQLRQKRRQAIALLDSLTQSIFLEMFGEQDPRWPVVQLRDAVKKGTIVTYGIVQAGEEFDGGVPYIRTGDIQNGSIDVEGLRHTDPAVAAKFARSRVEAGEIVISIRATVGTTALVPPELDGANLTQGTARISPGAMLSTDYLLSYLRSDPIQHWIQKQVKGATFREITLARLRDLEVTIPSMQLQIEFSRTIAKVKRMTFDSETALQQTTSLFASLQHRAFTGQL